MYKSMEMYVYMKLTILGNCGPYPTVGGACSGYLLESDSGRTRLLIDCGTGVLSALLGRLSLDRLDAVILSHLHFDHMSDMLPMQYALQFNPRGEPLPIYAPKQPEPVRSLLEASCYALRDMEDCVLSEMKLSFHAVRHPVESYGLRVECDGRVFAYTGDSNETASLDSLATGADLLLADAGLSDGDWSLGSPHLSAAGCGRLAARCGVGRLLLTHLNPRYSPEQHEAEARSHFASCAFCRIGGEYQI